MKKRVKEKNDFAYESQLARKSGLRVVLTLYSEIQDVNTKNLDEYAKRIREVITKAKPSVVAVEHREGSDIEWEYSFKEYESILMVACKELKSLNVKCTNGGMEGDMALAFTLSKLKRSDSVAYEEVLKTLDPWKYNFFAKDEYSTLRTDFVRTAEKLVQIYLKAKIDFINIHWEDLSEVALRRVVEFFRSEFDLDVISTEFVKPQNKVGSKKLMAAVHKLKMKSVIWYFGAEGHDSSWLIDKEGSLTEYAKSLGQFIWWKYNKKPRIHEKKDENRNKE